MQSKHGILVLGEICGLKIGPFVPVQPEPFQAIKDFPDRFLRGPFRVGVFDPQDEDPIVLFCPEPIIERCTRPTYMQITRG